MKGSMKVEKGNNGPRNCGWLYEEMIDRERVQLQDQGSGSVSACTKVEGKGMGGGTRSECECVRCKDGGQTMRNEPPIVVCELCREAQILDKADTWCAVKGCRFLGCWYHAQASRHQCGYLRNLASRLSKVSAKNAQMAKKLKEVEVVGGGKNTKEEGKIEDVGSQKTTYAGLLVYTGVTRANAAVRGISLSWLRLKSVDVDPESLGIQGWTRRVHVATPECDDLVAL